MRSDFSARKIRHFCRKEDNNTEKKALQRIENHKVKGSAMSNEVITWPQDICSEASPFSVLSVLKKVVFKNIDSHKTFQNDVNEMFLYRSIKVIHSKCYLVMSSFSYSAVMIDRLLFWFYWQLLVYLLIIAIMRLLWFMLANNFFSHLSL